MLFVAGGGGMCDKVSDSAYNKVYIFVKFSKLIIAMLVFMCYIIFGWLIKQGGL